LSCGTNEALHISVKNCYILIWMKYAIISDIHSNLEAFTAVLEDIMHRGGVEEIWCLGDVVGYGPDPHKCIKMLRQCNHICVAGNHDVAVAGKIGFEKFNPDAGIVCRWSVEQVTAEDKKYLASLPLTVEKGVFTLVHGSPREPVWQCVDSNSIARENFSFFKTDYCLVGHSHKPLVFKNEEGNCSSGHFVPNVGLALGKNHLIISPGGVGQPRDGNPLASYAIYDSEAVAIRLYRIPYDMKATQDKMMRRGLPVRLVTRLEAGR